MTPLKVFLFAFVFTTLLACASQPETQTVDVPVAVSCAAMIDNRPRFPDTRAAIVAAANVEARVNLILAGRLLRDKRIDELEAALSGCS